LAVRQHGVVARRQLVELGLGRGQIGHRLDAGRLQPVHHGVYAVGHRALSREGRWVAAVLAAGPNSALSRQSAAALWGIRDTARADADVVSERRVRRRRGIRPHRARLPSDERAVVRGIPVTTVARTVLDLAAVPSRSQLERAISAAEARRLGDSRSLDSLLDRYPGRRGVATIKAIIVRREIGTNLTRSELEHRFVAFLGSAELPRPQTNVSLEAAGLLLEVDCLWRAERLVVELDGYAFHGSAESYERDRARDRALSVAGWRVVRVTWRQLHDDPGRLATDLRRLAASGGRRWRSLRADVRQHG
jgi:Protein of unknown function (DUF559)/Transcriptional regulator, AbiEi antitoxin